MSKKKIKAKSDAEIYDALCTSYTRICDVMDEALASGLWIDCYVNSGNVMETPSEKKKVVTRRPPTLSRTLRYGL